MTYYRFALCTSLEKVFPEKPPKTMEREEEKLQIFHGERTAFQLAYYVDHTGTDLLEENLCIEVKASPGIRVSLYRVGLAPSAFPCDGAHDEDYLTTSPGMFPDILWRLDEPKLRGICGQWRSVWIELMPEKNCPDGMGEVSLLVHTEKREVFYQKRLPVDVLCNALPRQRLIHTEHLHIDCLADYYRAEVFSERHWELIKNFMKTAAERGINMVLTPLFTPPLDTGVGLERTTVQLIDVEKHRENYRFDFRRLERWIDLVGECGIQYMEMAHLFSQWGAKYAPKIIAVEEGERRQIFGWESPGDDPAYLDFLRQFLPELKRFLEEKGVLDRVWFHVSDEPTKIHLETYQKAHRWVKELLPGCRILDALSDYAFYELGIVEHPVVSTDHMEAFVRAGVKDLWAYYCCAQGVDVSNRFFAMPSCRNRILGVQLYLYAVEGFLHWGYNFYNTRFSAKKIDPFAVTDCGENFPSGDAFLVYPGEDGKPVPSIRFAVLEHALNDLRALQYLESLTSRAYVVRQIEDRAGVITWKQYPRNPEFILQLRRWVNEEIKQRSPSDKEVR